MILELEKSQISEVELRAENLAPRRAEVILDTITARVFQEALAELDAKRAAESGKIRKGEKDGFATDAT